MRTFITIALLLLFIVVIAYLVRHQSQPPSKQTPTNISIGQRTKTDNCHVNGPYPDRECSPGAIFPNVTAKEVCVRGYSKSVRNVPVAVKRQVYAEYGIRHHSSGEYEVDHIISLELGGSNDIANLFPEAAEPRPGFHEKDKVENYLHREVCSGRVFLKEAQYQIAADWLKIYKSMSNRN